MKVMERSEQILVVKHVPWGLRINLSMIVALGLFFLIMAVNTMGIQGVLTGDPRPLAMSLGMVFVAFVGFAFFGYGHIDLHFDAVRDRLRIQRQTMFSNRAKLYRISEISDAEVRGNAWRYTTRLNLHDGSVVRLEWLPDAFKSSKERCAAQINVFLAAARRRSSIPSGPAWPEESAS